MSFKVKSKFDGCFIVVESEFQGNRLYREIYNLQDNTYVDLCVKILKQFVTKMSIKILRSLDVRLDEVSILEILPETHHDVDIQNLLTVYHNC